MSSGPLKNIPSWFQGELLGTFLLVFFGCGSVATAVAMGAPVGLFQVAIVWGLGLTVAILLTGGKSGAHLNPAITLAFATFSDTPWKRVPGYMVAQFLGAFLAAIAIYLLFGGGIARYELVHEIERGAPGSEATAMIFGEFYPNPGGQPLTEELRQSVSHGQALLAEFLGTALLALAIFGIISPNNPIQMGNLTPLAIGLTLTVLICIFAPVSMGGFNPARDLAPRIFSVLAGWGSIPFSTNGVGWLTVYILAPCAGAMVGGFLGSRWFPAR